MHSTTTENIITETETYTYFGKEENMIHGV